MSLLDEVIEAHGGRRRWGKVREVSAHVRTGGLLLRSKGKAGRFDCGISVVTDRQSAVFEPYPSHGRTGVFEQGTVRILDEEGRVIAERENAREAFFGRSGLTRKAWWSNLDSLYFGGYAMWNYLNTPFMLASDGFEVEEGEALEIGGDRCRRLDVAFPEDFHTHSRRQSFYFGDDGLLRRTDYTAQVIGGFARGANLTSNYRSFDGIAFPTRRRVVLRGPGNRPLPGPAVVTIELDSVSLS